MKSIIKEIYQNSKFKNSGTIKLILDSFSKDDTIRYWVARNLNTPVFILEKLSKDKDWRVRIGVSYHYNPKTPTAKLS